MRRGLALLPWILLLPIAASAQTTISGTLSANGPLSLGVLGMGTATVSVSGTFSGTINFEVANGTTPVAVSCTAPNAGAGVTTTTTTGSWVCSVAGFNQFIARMSGYVSGTASVILSAAPGGGNSVGAADVNSDSSLAALNTISTNTATLVANASVDAVQGDTVKASGPQVMLHGATTAPTAVTAGQAVRAWGTLNGATVTQRTDGTNLEVLDPCKSVAKTTTAFTQTTIANIITANASKTNYVCQITVVAAAAEIINVVEDDTSGCGSVTAALLGSTTAANGLSFAANGGLSMGNGDATVLVGSTTNRYLCISQNGANRISGAITWVQR